MVAERLLEAQNKKKPGRHIQSPTKERKLDINDLKEQQQ